MRGPCLLKSWRSTQRTVTLSSGESELLTYSRGGLEALDMVHVAKDFGENLEVNINIDAKTTMETLHRQGFWQA